MISGDGEAFELHTKGLDQLIKAMKGKGLTAKVGILGQTNLRKAEGGGTTSNATIGAAHEFGTSTLPQRSFLRMPISTKLPKLLKAADMFNPDTMKKIIAEGSFKQWVEQVAIMAVAAVKDAFDTGGFGTWKPSNMDRKDVKQTLVETQQLRDSITYEVK